MMQGQSVLAIVPARGGSKQLPRKNVKPLHGRPLIAWTIEAARRAQTVDRVLVSTDAAAIAETGAREGADVPLLRPAGLATDEADTAGVVLHALEWIEAHERRAYDLVVLLQPTSPLRTAADIDAGVTAFQAASGANSLVGVTESPTWPFWSHTLTGDGFRTPVFSGDGSRWRQDLLRTYMLNASLYVNPTGGSGRRVWFWTRRWRVSSLAAIVPSRSTRPRTILSLRSRRGRASSPRSAPEPTMQYQRIIPRLDIRPNLVERIHLEASCAFSVNRRRSRGTTMSRARAS